jgi:hypothetical protein
MGQRSSYAYLMFLLATELAATGCAGPTTPFGALPLSFAQAVVAEGADREVTPLTPSITFNPRRQILHGRTRLSIVIKDPRGIPRDYDFMITYNGIDVTRRFLMQAETFADRTQNFLRLAINDLRILPSKENKIEVMYWRSRREKPVFAKYLPPQCLAFRSSPVLHTGEFEVSKKFISLVEQEAEKVRFNPSYVAGLIAQESAFNARAVSTSKALGLTQITPLGEAEIIENISGWPRYPGINKMSLPVLKWRVAMGKINARNEWRLNPGYSVIGGIAYLNYLQQYWSKGPNYKLLTKYYADPQVGLSEVMLASYNSGASRVASAMQRHGSRWLADGRDLGEARKYVNRALSYCDHFSNIGEE